MNIASTTKYLVAVLAVCLLSQPIFAQNVIWSEDFGGGTIPAGWANYDPNDPTVVWEYETDSNRVTVSNPGFNGVAFQSTTVSNGFVIFDSDGYGQNVIHDVRLQTSAINCSNNATVVVRFQNQYAPFTTGSVAELGVSSDSINWTYFPLFASTTPGNTTPQIANQTEEVDISSVAGNQANVYLQWRWQGNWEYSWKLDDIIVQDAPTPLPTDDLAIGEFIFAPDNFGTPDHQIASDTFDFFGADVINLGSSDQNNVVVTAEIMDGANTLYMDTVHLGTIVAGDTVYADFDASTGVNYYIPNLMIGSYDLVYSVTSDATDINPGDNVATQGFEVNDSTFRKDGGLTTAYTPAGGGDFTVGNVYRTGDAFSTGDFIASSIEVNVASNGTIDGNDITVWLVEVSDNVNYDWDNFDASLDLQSNPNLTIVGFGSYTFPTGSANFDWHRVNLEDFTTGGYGVTLKPGTRYMALADVTGASGFFYTFGEQIQYFQISSILYTSAWFLGGFGPEFTAALRMNMVTPPNISTNQVELEDATLAVFPNPASQIATVELGFEESTDATLFISDVTGRVLHMENLNGIIQERVQLDVSSYAAGTYFVKVATTEGIKTQRLVVTH